MEELKVPKYEFTDVEEGVEGVSPIRRTISKTMEVTEMFSVFDCLQYLAKMEKAIADKEAEIEGLKNMKEAYEKELKLIEDAIGVQKMEEEYQKELAENIQPDTEAVLSPLNDEYEKTN